MTPLVLAGADNRSEWTTLPRASDRIYKEELAARNAEMEMWVTIGAGALIALPVSITLGFVCVVLFLLNIKKRLMARLGLIFGAFSMLSLTALVISMIGCAEIAQ